LSGPPTVARIYRSVSLKYRHDNEPAIELDSSPARSSPLGAGTIVAIAGCGTMGAGIGQVAALAGHIVKLYDLDAQRAIQTAEATGKRIRKLADAGRMSQPLVEGASKRLNPVARLEDFADANLVIEAIVENADIKRELFAKLETVIQPECILATNTSSLSINFLSSGLRNPGRFAGMHFFNPVPLMRLVEVVHGLGTDPAVANIVFETATRWGKVPIHVKSTPGFVVNRIARPYYAEALRLLNEQAAQPITLDAIMRDCGGFRMGPFELMDLIGLDVNFAVTQSVFEAYFCDPRFSPSTIQREMVNAGYLGRKSGRGFFTYDGRGPTTPPAAELQQAAPLRISLKHDSALGKAIISRLLATVEVLPISNNPDERIIEIGDAVVYQTDGRTATARASANDIPNTMLCDIALDYQTAPRIALTQADTCSPDSFQAVVGLFQSAGYVVSEIDDVAGMMVMRTVAMLANEACDAVNQGVCTMEAADTAMRLGMNYPLGPFAWAEELGVKNLLTVLTHLASHYGEDRYRISPRLRRLC
jgi:3-hydroxybutyryl-CoA dehydrogenase